MKFRLVDKITSWAPYGRITGIKTVSFEEYSLKEAFGAGPSLPETLLLESFLQLGNWLIILSSEFQQMGLVARLARVEFRPFSGRGHRIHLEVQVIRRREGGLELAGSGQVNGCEVISGSGCVAGLVPLAEHGDPQDLRVLFSEIYEPGEACQI